MEQLTRSKLGKKYVKAAYCHSAYLTSLESVRAQMLQSCLTLCNPMDCSLPSSSVTRFSKQKYWSGLPCPPPEDLPDPGIEPVSPASAALQADFLLTESPGKLSMQSTSYKMLSWMSHKLESRLPEEISISDMQMILL